MSRSSKRYVPYPVLSIVFPSAPDQASGLASSYVDMLRANPRLGTVFDPITLRNLNREAEPGVLVFDISLTVKQK